jgi:hypothetical protein
MLTPSPGRDPLTWEVHGDNEGFEAYSRLHDEGVRFLWVVCPWLPHNPQVWTVSLSDHELICDDVLEWNEFPSSDAAKAHCEEREFQALRDAGVEP